jgi:hypothetical protein
MAEPLIWREAVLAALRRYASRHQTPYVERAALIAEEMAAISAATQTRGASPEQTLSRVLQELRGEHLAFMGGGRYRLLDQPIGAAEWGEGVGQEAIEDALRANRLPLPDVQTGDVVGVGRVRRGQAALRRLTLHQYGHRCALCDIEDDRLLVAAHIVRWADDPALRGDLSNVICLCRFHDVLFEHGHVMLSDAYEVIRQPAPDSAFLRQLLAATGTFRAPSAYPPHPAHLARHRQRVSP